MNRGQLEGIVRHVLTFVGGMLILKGVLDESTLNEIIGAAVTLSGGIWSILSKK
jgi:hypothetical protein